MFTYSWLAGSISIATCMYVYVYICIYTHGRRHLPQTAVGDYLGRPPSMLV